MIFSILKFAFRVLLILAITYQSVFSQTVFKPGYIISSPGDTLYGQIDYRGDYRMGNICSFRKNEQVKDFSPGDIIGYRFLNGKYYISKKINGKQVFLEFLVSGKVNIYYLRDLSGDHFYIENETSPLVEIPYTEKIVKDGLKSYVYESKAHINFLKFYMPDAPNLDDNIRAIKKPTPQTLTQLAEKYHYMVCDDEVCIVYNKKPPIFKVSIEAIGGSFTLLNQPSSSKITSVVFGLLTHFNAHRVNEKLYLMTGLLSTSIIENDIATRHLKIPFHLEYIYPKGIIKPRISLGYNLYVPFFPSVSATGGLNVKLNNNLFLSLWSEIEFEPTYEGTNWQTLGYYINGGIFLKL